MNHMKVTIGRLFYNWGMLVFRYKVVSLIGLLALFFGLLSQIPNITVDTSSEGFLHADDPVLVDYQAFRDQYGRDEFIVIAIRAEELFSLEFLGVLKEIHHRLENQVPHLGELTSLINARRVYGRNDSLVVEDLFEQWPETEQDLLDIKNAVISSPHYTNFLVDQELQYTALVVRINYLENRPIVPETSAAWGISPLLSFLMPADDDGVVRDQTDIDSAATANVELVPLSGEQLSEAVTQIRAIVDAYKKQGLEIYVAGSSMVFEDVKASMHSNMKVFVGSALLIIIVVLGGIFRRPSGVILPLVTVVLSVLSTVSVMAILGVSIKLPTQILPSFILAVGVGDSIHLLSYFYRRFNQTGDKQEALSYSLGQVGVPLVMTSLTTALGLLSFAFAEIAPVAELGIYASVGVGFALLYTLVLLPVLISICPIKQNTSKVQSNEQSKDQIDSLLSSVGRFSTSQPGLVFFTSLLIVAISLNGITLIQVSHDPLGWLPAQSDIRLSTNVIDQRLKGSNALEVIVDTGQEYGVVEPQFLTQIDSLGTEIMLWQDSSVAVGSVRSLVDYVKEINQALNGGDDQHYIIPDNRALIAQELFLFEFSGSDDLEMVTDHDFKQVRISMKLPWTDVLRYGDLLDRVEKQFNNAFPASYNITFTGVTMLLGRTLQAVVQSTLVSYLFAGCVISLLMIVLMGNLKIGLISLVPNLFPIVCVLGLMGYAGLPLDMFTMLIGSIAVGVAVDDTIHFMHRFQSEYRKTNNLDLAVENTLHSTGRAMLSTSVVLSLGFFVFCLSDMGNLYAFGLLTGAAIILALLADFLIAPALLKLVHKT